MRGPQAFSKGDQMNVLAYGLIITVLGGHPVIDLLSCRQTALIGCL